MNTQNTNLNPNYRNAISGVLLAKVNRDHLIKVMKVEKIEFEKDDEIGALTVIARAHFEKNTPDDNLAQCDTCGGISPDRLDACPYCGEGGEDGGEAQQPKAAAEPEAPKTEVVETKTTPAKQKKGKEATMGGESTALATTKKKNGTNGTAAHAPIVKVDTKELDTIVADIKRLKVEGAALAWQLGKRVLDVYKAGLWKNRTEGEKQSYKSFEQFCNKELDMTPAHAYSLMDVAEHFDEQKVREFGSTKLSLVLQAPPAAQPKLLKQVEQGAAVRDLKKEVSSIKKKTGHRREQRAGSKPNRNTAAASKARSEKAAKAKKEITVAKLLGRETVKMFCKPTTKNFEEKDLKPAKKLGDVPWGRLELANGVVQEFFIQGGGDGAIKLVVHTHRTED